MLFQYRNTADANFICLQCAVLTEFNVWQISEAFKRFGISDSDSAVHIVLVHNKDETLNIEDIISKVDGEQIAVDRVSDLTDAAKIKKVCLLSQSIDVEQFRVHRLLHLFEMYICVSLQLYKVAPQEEQCGSLLDSVVCRMATKDVA